MNSQNDHQADVDGGADKVPQEADTPSTEDAGEEASGGDIPANMAADSAGSKRQSREQRLAAALRANLRRRKQQASTLDASSEDSCIPLKTP